MGLNDLGFISLDWVWFSALLSVITINLVRSVDNAMVIAIALRALPRRLRSRALIFGACITIVLSVLLTFFASKMLQHSFVKLAGGLIVFYLAVTLLVLTGSVAGALAGAHASRRAHVKFLRLSLLGVLVLILIGVGYNNLF